MRCQNCGGDSEKSFNPRVSINSIQETLQAHRGKGTLHLNRSKIQQVLRDGEKDLEDYAVEISRLQARIMFIQQKKDRLEDYLRQYGSLIAPIRRLPDDMLRKIFERYCELPQNRFLRQPTRNPFLVSAVCSHWRSIALSTPIIWSKIVVSFEWRRDPQRLLPLLKLQLERSREVGLDLDLSFIYPSHSSPEFLEHLEQSTFQTLASQSHRWKKLLFLGYMIFPLKNHTIDSFPTLENLTLKIGDVPTTLNFAPMPKLRSFAALSWQRIHHTDPVFPWSQLTELELTSVSNIPQFLDACTSLTSLRIHVNIGSKHEEQSEAPVVHHGVHKLSILFERTNPNMSDPAVFLTTGEVLAILWNKFTFPNLASFSFEADIFDHFTWPPGAVNAYMNFFERSGRRLTTMSIIDADIFHPHLINILRKSSSLVDLTLGDSRIDKDAREDTTQPGASTVSTALLKSLHAFRQSDELAQPNPILPHLQKLSLHIYNEFDEDVFIATIASRWIPSEDYAKEIGLVSLRKVELRLGDQYHRIFDAEKARGQLSSLKVLRKQGMVVDVICAGEYVEL